MSRYFAVLSIGLFYLSALNTLAARFAGTCTQGDADRLAGILITAILSTAAVWLMRASSREPMVLVAIAPVLLVFAWQAVFSLRLGYELLWLDSSACQVLTGVPHAMDGHEYFYGLAWPLVSILVPVSIGLAWWNRRNR